MFDTIVADDASPAVRASIFIAAIGSWSLIATGDLLARADATANATSPGLGVTLTRGVDEPGSFAVAVRPAASDPHGVEVLLVKPGREPEWVGTGHVRFD